MFLEHCRAVTAPIWHAYTTHPWIEAMAAGTLTPEQFAFFQLDDGAHVAEFNRTLALGIAKAPAGHPWAKAAAHVLDDMSTTSELEEKRKILLQLGYDVPAQPDRWSCSPAREAYVNHLVRVGYEGTLPEIAIALYPCAMFVEVIGNRFRNIALPGPAAFTTWADMYKRATRTEMRDQHAAVVEDAALRMDIKGQDRLLQLYTRSLHHQLRVFDAAYHQNGSWPAGRLCYAQQVIDHKAAHHPGTWAATEETHHGRDSHLHADGESSSASSGAAGRGSVPATRYQPRRRP
ncbi:TenA family protein [Streptomyces sp. NPDC088748]|uniref:TenA family protein n=1 Tax=Streptomyces sp. NPDC088748 TaxID=3365887 RepID=UPI00381A6418